MTFARRSKYRSIPTVVDGIRFASKKEANRYAELKLMEKAGAIRDLILQPMFALHAPNGAYIGKYLADFTYWLTENDKKIYEDVKGMKTALYRWKKKHVEAQYGIVIAEV